MSQSVSLVWAPLSFATTPRSPAWSLATSKRSLPMGIERWFSFSTVPRSPFLTSWPLLTEPLTIRK